MKKLTLSQKILKPWFTAFLISIIYTIVGGMWVFFSEPVLSKWVVDPETFRTAKIVSQWLFIVISAQMLFLLIRHRELAFHPFGRVAVPGQPRPAGVQRVQEGDHLGQ